MSMPTPRISLVIVTYNGEPYMEGLFASVQAQTLQPVEVIVVENSPENATVPSIKKCYPAATILLPGKNLDFSRGYNFGIQHASGDYICIVNQDITLDPHALEYLYNGITQNERIGAVAPKLRRLEEGKKESNTIDSMGITGSRARRFTNSGEGEQDHGQYDEQEPFGIAGTAILFRKEALEDIAKHGGGGEKEYFDDDFVAYKDDVDLSYRLRHRGWKIGIIPEAIMYHERTAQELKASEGLRADRHAKSLRIRSNSLRNHWWVIIKNEPAVNILMSLPWILWYEFRKLLYIFICEPSTFKAIPSFISGLPRIIKKRKAILSSSQLKPEELRKWFP